MQIYDFRAPNGKIITVRSKDGSMPTEGEVYGMFQKAYPDDEAFKETVLERIGSAVGSAVQSAVGIGVKAMEYLDKLSGHIPATTMGNVAPRPVKQLNPKPGDKNQLLEDAKAVEASIAEAVPTLPQARESFVTGDVPSAVGSLAGGVAAGLVGGAGGAMAVMFGAEAQDAYDREIARQQKAGEQKNEDKAMFKATLYGTGATAIEYGLGAGYILRKIGEKFGKKAVTEVAEKVAETGWERVAGALREGGKGGLAGFVEETAQSALQQKVVEGTVNWREAFREGAAGAVGQGGVATAVGLIPQSSQAVNDTEAAMKEVAGEPGKIEGVPEAVQAANTPTETPPAQTQQEAAPQVEQQKKTDPIPEPEIQPLKLEPWEEGQRPGVIEIQLISTKQRVADGINGLLDPKNKKAAMIVPEWFNTGAVPEGLLVVPTAKGNVLFNPKKTSAKRIVRNLKRPDFNLGKQRRKPSPQTPQQQQGTNEEEKGQQKEVLGAGTASNPPTPERVDQIMEQLRLTGDPASTKAATLITPGSPIPKAPDGMIALDTKHGTVVYNPAKISAQEITKAAEGEVFDGRVLGMASATTPIAGTTVVSTSTPAAPDVIAEVVQDTPSAIAEATIAQQKAVPGGQTEIKPAQDVVNERKAPRIEPPIESRDQTVPSRSVAWDYEVVTTTHEARSKWAEEQVAKFKPDELGQAARSAVEDARLTPDKRLVLLAKIAKKATQNADIETSQYVGKALEALSQQQGQGLESLKQVIDELTPYAPLLAYMKAVKPKGDLANVPATGPIREAWNELKRALGNTMSLGAVADPEAIAKAQIDVYKALFRLAKVAAQEGVKSAKEFAERFGLKLTDSVKHAWQQAKTEQDPKTPPPNILKDAGRLVISEPKKRRAKAQEFSQEVYDKMKGLAERAAKLKDGSQEQNALLQQMTRQLEDSLGLGLKDALLSGDWWFASVLMRVGTFENVAVGSASQGVTWSLLSAFDTATFKASPRAAMQMMSAFWQGVMDGSLVAKEIVRTGNYALLPDYKQRVEKFLLGKKGGRGDAFEAMLRRGNWIGALAYTRRIMTAIDYIAAQGTRDAALIYASLSAGDQASLDRAQDRFDRQKSMDAREQARNELGKDAPALQVRLRAREILEEGIDSEILENSIQLARRAAQNADPQGISGVVYRAVNHLGFVGKALLGLPFLRSAFNMIRNTSEFVPGVGTLTYIRSSKTFRDKVGDTPIGKILALDIPPEQRRLLIAAQITGTGMLVAGAAWALDDKDHDWLEVSGGWRNITPQQAKELRAVGEQPYSIRVGDKWWSYKQLPIAAVLAMIGGIRDNRRFDKEKWDEKEVMDKVITSAFSGVAYFKDVSALNQLANLFNGNAGSTQEETVDSTNKFLANMVGRYLSGYVPSIIKEVEQFLDPTVRAPLRDDLLGQWLKYLPVTFQEFVGQKSRPSLDFFGEPIKATPAPIGALAKQERPEPEYRLVAKWMSEGLFIPQAGRTAKVVDKDTTTLRRMTDTEFYDYQREYGQFIKKQITSNMEFFQSATKEQLAEILPELGSDASQYARGKLD